MFTSGFAAALYFGGAKLYDGRMMSGHVLHAGQGYAYLLSTVATADEPTSAKTGLFDYYESRGTPAGRWTGRGIASLGETTVAVDGVVSEEQMAALFGEGLHPDADARLLAGEYLEDVKLGRSFPLYSGGDPVLEKITAAERAERKELGRRLTTAERSDLVASVARKDYIEFSGETNPLPRDVVSWARGRQEKVKQATSGFDLTFSPVKSVSMLWALGSNEVREKIEHAHHNAVSSTLEWIEDNALFCRDSTGGCSTLVRTTGMIAARFDHFETRAGDPDLHTHVAVSNKVFDPKANKWKSVDSRTLLKNVAASSSRYNVTLMDELDKSLGLSFVARDMGEGKIPVYEVAGIPQELIDAGSKRRELIVSATHQLVDGYIQRHGRSPSRSTVYKLSQQATLDTRQDKGQSHTLASLRGQWRDEFADVVGGKDALDQIMQAIVDTSPTASSVERSAGDGRLILPVSATEERGMVVATIAADAVNLAASRRVQFTNRHLDTAVSQMLREWRLAPGDSLNDVHAEVLHAAKNYAVSLTPEVTRSLPDRLVQDSGLPVDRTSDWQVYTSPEVIKDERAVRDSARTLTPFTVAEEAISAAVESYNATHEFGLNQGQEAMVRHLATTGTQTAVAVGPAGSGKTTAMAVLADVWRAQGAKVVALSSQKSAAQNLGEEISAPGMTLASFVYPWRGRYEHTPAGVVDALPVALNPGDMLLVDEAGMATTDDLAALTEIANATGAVIRMVGDPQQLGPVGRGGVFDYLCSTTNAPTLNTVVRMGSDEAQAVNTLALREGKTEALNLFYDRGWVHSGARSVVVDKAINDHLHDRVQGLNSLIIAPTNRDVSTINTTIQSTLASRGIVDLDGPLADLKDGHAGVGDTLLARRNARIPGNEGHTIEVNNSDLFRLDLVLPDGSGLARRLHSGGSLGQSVHLPRDYMATSMQLGYGATVHRSQGATVDVTRAVVDGSVSRQLLYVAATRGKKENHLYPVTEPNVATVVSREDQHEHLSGDDDGDSGRGVLEAILATDDAPISALAVADRNTADEFSTERSERLYRTAATELARDYASHVIDNAVSYLPGAVGADIDDEARNRLVALASTIVTTRTDHYSVITDAVTGVAETDFGTVDQIADNLREATPEKPDKRGLPLLAPVWEGQDGELRLFAQTLHDDLVGQKTGVVNGATIVGEDLRGADLRGIVLEGVTFVDCWVEGLDLSGSVLTNTSFFGCNGAAHFADAQLGAMADTTGVQFIDCALPEANFAGADLQRLTITGGRLNESVWDGATCHNVSISGATTEDSTADNLTITGSLALEGSEITSGLLDEATNTPEVVTDTERYRQGARWLASNFGHHVVTQARDLMPTALSTTEEAQLVTAVAEAAVAGVDVRDHWGDLTSGLTDSDEAARTLIFRMQDLGTTGFDVPQLPPVWDGEDTTLRDRVQAYGQAAGVAETPAAPRTSEQISSSLCAAFARDWMTDLTEAATGLYELSGDEQAALVDYAAALVSRGLDLAHTAELVADIAKNDVFSVGDTPSERIHSWLTAKETDLDPDARATFLPPESASQDPQLREQLAGREDVQTFTNQFLVYDPDSDTGSSYENDQHQSLFDFGTDAGLDY